MRPLNTKHQTLNTVIVTHTPSLILNGKEYPCAIGKNGFAEPDEKREGDNKTPVGIFPLRSVYYRADRIARPKTKLPVHEITKSLGWCDDPAHPDYNKPVTLPFSASHEKMWREDHCYDLVVVIGYNDDPAIADNGSAIFIHCEHDDDRPTAGCIALKKDILLSVIKDLNPGATLSIGAD